MNIKYRVASMEFKYIKSHVKVPKFQRGIVWNSAKREGLIETIKKGLPIGTLLLSAIGKEEYKIIDGLQRYTTLEEYSNNPIKFIGSAELTLDLILSIIENTKSAETYEMFSESNKQKQIELIKNAIMSVAKNIKSIDQFSFAELLLDELQDTFIDTDGQTILKNAISIYVKLSSALDITNLTIPIIIFTGLESDLVEVYTKLNSEGVKLSKYDVFAASWNDIILNLGKDKYKVIDKIIERYDLMYDNTEIEIIDYDPIEFKLNGEVNLFEFCYALGKIISIKSSLLFSNRNKKTVESLGFTILALFFNVKNNNMKEMGKRVATENVDLTDFIGKLLSVLEALEKELDPWLKCLDGKRFTPHSEFQIVSYIMFLFKLKYTRSNGTIIPISGSHKKVNQYLNFIHKHYIFDILRRHWAGSGDTTMDDLVLGEITNSHRLLNDIDKQSFYSTLYNYLTEENMKTKLNITKENKLLLNYLLRININPNQVPNTKFDFDHIVPQQRFNMKKNIKKFMAISSPCNLCLIPRKLNRSKGDRTIYEDISNSILKNVDLVLLNKFSYPTESELNFIKDPNLFTIDNYNLYLKNRANYITNSLTNSLFK